MVRRAAADEIIAPGLCHVTLAENGDKIRGERKHTAVPCSSRILRSVNPSEIRARRPSIDRNSPCKNWPHGGAVGSDVTSPHVLDPHKERSWRDTEIGYNKSAVECNRSRNLQIIGDGAATRDNPDRIIGRRCLVQPERNRASTIVR